MSAIGIFARLGFPASMSTNTIEFSNNTKNSLNNMPQILQTWQMEDIANNAVNGYLLNPVNAYASNIITTLSSIEVSANTYGFTTIKDAANSMVMANTATYFLNHTDRISGVSPVDPNNGALPHYTTCIGLGKALTYIVYQSDGISNNAVIMGNFGSLYTANTVSSHAANLYSDLLLVQTGSLTAGQITAIIADITSANSFLYSSYYADESYFANCRSVIQDYSSVKQFSSMGDTEKNLVNTLIGTNKLKSRIS